MTGWLDTLTDMLGGMRGTRAVVARVYRQGLIGDGLDMKSLAEAAPGLDPDDDSRVLAELFIAETRQIDAVPDSALRARLWSMLDRFERIVPEATRMRYWQIVPALADPQWSDPAFLRDQLQALQRQIHRSHLIKQAREEETIRLRTMVFGVVAVLVVLFLGGAAVAAGFEALLTLGFGYFILLISGVLGAAVSYMRRLQAAMDHDAAASDGLAELQALRGSRISALSSILLGGIFAVLIYWLSIAGLFATLVPETAGQASLMSAQRTAEDELAARRADLARLQAMPAADQPAATPEELAAARTALADAERRQRILDSAAAVQPAIASCPAPSSDDLSATTRNTACHIGTSYARLMGLADARSFYLMLILAFLAGFAEQLVPDKLKQLTQRYSGPAAGS
jgi:hypothetical protein